MRVRHGFKVILGISMIAGAALAADFNITSSFDFTAPLVYDRTATTLHKQTGMIVHDLSEDTHFGFDRSGGWVGFADKATAVTASTEGIPKSFGGSGYYADADVAITLTAGTWALYGQGKFTASGGELT